MKILAIETSCDETAVSILECSGDERGAEFRVLGNALISQIDIHREFGGVYPAVAKREHAKNLVPLLSSALEEAELLREDTQVIPDALHEELVVLLEREPVLAESLFAFIEETERPDIDAIAVTHGPGLAPALWVGVNLARALSLLWKMPIVPVNHLEGHILSALAKESNGVLHCVQPTLPLLALGIAGGHTDLVVMRKWLSYETIGGTLDDSVGEAFDKVARMLDLPYPGGPQISKLAEEARVEGLESIYTLPRPMLHSGTNDFSFSGLKTAVLYTVKKMVTVGEMEKKHIALEFENAVADVLWAKTSQALQATGARILIVSGGVSANTHVCRVFKREIEAKYPDVTLLIPPLGLATDNAVMIGIAGYFRALRKEFASVDSLSADGNLSLSHIS